MQFFTKDSKNEDFNFVTGSRMREMAKLNINPPQGFMSEAGW